MELWQKNLYMMIIVQFVLALAMNILNPFLPLFVYELGVTGQRELTFWAGLLVASNAFFQAVFAPVWGSLSDRYGHKSMVVRAAVSISIFTFLTSYATSVYHVLWLRILMGFFSGVSATTVIFVASQTPSHRIGYALGALQTGQIMGMVVGPMMGGVLADITSFRHVFQITGALAFLATLVATFFVHEPIRVRREKEANDSLLAGLQASIRLPAIGAMFLVMFLVQFSVRVVEPILPIYVKSLAGDTARLGSLTGGVFAITGLSQAVAAVVLGKKSDTWGHRRVLIIALSGASLLYVLQSFAHTVPQILVLRFFLGFFLGGTLPMANALIARFAPDSMKGRIYGLTSSANFMGNFAGPLTGGILAGALGLRSIFWFTAGLMALNIFWIRRTVPGDRTAAKPAQHGDAPGY